MTTTVKLPLSVLVFSGTLILFLLLNSFRLEHKIENFDVINVKRLNIIEKDGTLRMVISNKELQHSGRMDGQDWEQRERPAGLIFFNDEGDECGGLIYETKKLQDGSRRNGMSVTMDQYRDDQVIQILNDERVLSDKIISERGLSINNFPAMDGVNARNNAYEKAEKISDEKLRATKLREINQQYGSKNLLFLGKTKGNSQGLFIADHTGQPKLMIYVDEKGEPKIQTFAADGSIKDFLVTASK